MGTTLGKKEGVIKAVRVKKTTVVKSATKIKPTSKKPKNDKLVKKESKDLPQVAETNLKRKKSSPKETKGEVSEVVFVPGAASLRLLEKAHLYALWYEKNLPTAMSVAAKVGGYAFIFAGTLFAVFSYIDNDKILGNSAAIVCSDSACAEIPSESLPISAPSVEFINSIPSFISTDTDFKISAKNVTQPVIIITSVETGSEVVVDPAEKIGDFEFRFLLPGSRLAPASYKIEAVAVQEDKKYIFTGPTFKVLGDEVALTEKRPLTIEAVEEANNTNTTSSATSSESDIEQPALSEDSADLIATSSDLVSNEEDDESEDDAVKVSSQTNAAPISISLFEQAEMAYVKIQTGNFAPNNVEVYSQVKPGGQSIYLGKATMVQGEWVLSVSALELPKAEHYLYGSFLEAGRTYTTEAVVYKPYYDTASSLNSEADLSILVQKIELALLASNVNNQNRRQYFEYFSSQPEQLFALDEELRFASESLIDVINTKMTEERDILQSLLLKYATAIQSENAFLTAFGSKALSDYSSTLAATVASVIGEEKTVPSIHTLLSLRFQILKDKIKESEEQIKQDTNNLTAKDSDQDGLSDFDEVANFNSNPLAADTDSDGVIDGVELFLDYDPISPDIAEIPPLFNDYDDTSFNEVVKLSFVGPQIRSQNGIEEHYVLVEGQSIPNSHIYIVSESTDTIGVVKTSPTGSFSYTVERNFTDGNHSISAVLADNNGQIVASSKPYKFSRVDNAFVAATISSLNNSTSQAPEDDMLLHVLVAAIGVITFGFILLLLSNVVKNRKVAKIKAI